MNDITPEALEAKAAELENAANWLREPFGDYKSVSASYSRAPKDAAKLLRDAARELRRHTGCVQFGDERAFVDIRAAVVGEDGGIVRSLNGRPMTAGTSLYLRNE